MSRIVTSANNPLLASQWHLGQIFRGDPNRIWSEFSGAGVKVGVYDDGIDKSHIDLRNRYDSSRELVINGQRLDASTGSAVHGTAVAGLIAADANNGAGGVGVAHSAMLTGVNIFSGIGASSGFINAIRGMSSFDVTNSSWGWSSRYADSAHQSGSFGNLFAAAVKNVADTGRGGLGTIVVNAAGNEGGEGRDANMSNFNAMRQTITVGAIGQDGDVAGYATRGASVLVSGPSNGGGAGIVTTDVSGSRGYASSDYTSGFGGTSAASPIVSGVVSVMLSANRKLGWRDVQDILAITADHTTPASLSGGVSGRMQSGWTVNKADNVNGGGLHYSNDVGFGRVDALEAVRFAEVWSRFGNAQTSANEQVVSVSGAVNRAIADHQTTEFKVNVARNIEVESAAITLTLTHGNMNDLRVELVSPEGTRSVVLSPSTGSNAANGLTWTYTTEALRGETSLGEWTVRVTDTRTGATGSIASYKLDVYGDAISANDVYHYTNEFGKMAALDANRAVLRDTDGGIDWINAAGTTDAAIVNLNQGGVSTIHGRNLTIATGTVIENAVTGDGNDLLTGNDAANVLMGMRGNDTLDGRAGADTLDGGAGVDTATYAFSNAAVDVNLTRASQFGGHAQGDVLVSIENLIGSTFNDVLTGDAGANLLDGGAGNDILRGGAGNDTLRGGTGNDVLIGGAGADVLDGGDGLDTASYAESTAAVSFTVGAPHLGTGDAAGDSFVSIESFIGSNFNDVITGSAATETINGGAGNDTLSSGGGNDTLMGGAGNDLMLSGSGRETFNGGDGVDTVSYSRELRQVVVDLTSGAGMGAASGDRFVSIENIIGTAFNDTINGNAANNVLDGGAGNDRLFGGAGNDTLFGGAGNDILEGGIGNDVLYGGFGDDILVGGAGNDRFCFDVRNFGNDRIVDFQDGRDMIDLRGLGLSFASLAIISTGQSYVVSGAFGTITVSGAERGILSAADFVFA